MRTLAMLACLAIVPVCATANSIVPVHGSGFWNGAVTAGFGGTFGAYDLSSSLPSGSAPVAVCPPTGICNANPSVGAIAIYGYSLVTQNGANVGLFFGNLNVTTSFEVPSGPLGSSIQVSAPALVSGNVEIVSQMIAQGGVPIATYAIIGVGAVDLSGTIGSQGDWFNNGNFAFLGLATDSAATPEPGSLMLFGLGLAAVGFRLVCQLRRCPCR